MAFTDSFTGMDGDSLSAPGYGAAAITTADTDQNTSFRAIYVGGAGDIKVDMPGGGTVTFVAVPQGTLLPIRPKRIYATGTTATNLVGLI
jgi:hypothetical protein